jgi:hypothetical protein
MAKHGWRNAAREFNLPVAVAENGQNGPKSRENWPKTSEFEQKIHLFSPFLT